MKACSRLETYVSLLPSSCKLKPLGEERGGRRRKAGRRKERREEERLLSRREEQREEKRRGEGEKPACSCSLMPAGQAGRQAGRQAEAVEAGRRRRKRRRGRRGNLDPSLVSLLEKATKSMAGSGSSEKSKNLYLSRLPTHCSVPSLLFSSLGEAGGPAFYHHPSSVPLLLFCVCWRLGRGEWVRLGEGWVGCLLCGRRRPVLFVLLGVLPATIQHACLSPIYTPSTTFLCHLLPHTCPLYSPHHQPSPMGVHIHTFYYIPVCL